MTRAEQILIQIREEHADCVDHTVYGSTPFHVDRRCEQCRKIDRILRTYPSNKNLELADSERHTVLLALATLAAERPGWTPHLEQIAMRIDKMVESEHPLRSKYPEMFTQFLRMKRNLSAKPTEQEIRPRRIKTS